MVSGQTILYQNESCGLPAGSTICWVMELSVDGLVLPTRAAYVPPCAPLLTRPVWPDAVQAESVPVSKPPLTTLPPPPPPAMVQLTAALCASVPLVPATVRLYVPAAADPAVRLSVELPPAATLAGLKLADAPAGKPEAASVTLPANPPLPATEMVLVALEPLTEAGLAARLKSGVDALQPETLLPGKQMESTACSSMALGATPVWPCCRSKKPTPVMVTSTFALWKLPVGVYFASIAAREALIIDAHGPPETQEGEGISAIMVCPAPSMTTRW